MIILNKKFNDENSSSHDISYVYHAIYSIPSLFWSNALDANITRLLFAKFDIAEMKQYFR